MKRFFRLMMSAAPFFIVAGLLYAGLFIKPESKGEAVPRPAFERGDRLYGLVLQPSGKGWLVGNNGKILSTQDGARSWQYAVSPVGASLQDVAAWDDLRAVAVGNDNVVIVTADGGKSWRKVDAPRSKIANKLLRVKTVADGRAWAVGEGGAILQSTDYGNSWTKVGAEEDTAWNDVFVREGQVWIVGERGRIRVSGDNGTSWSEVTGPIKMSLMSVAFRDAKNGVAVGLSGVILVSQDGGQTWQERNFSSPDRGSTGNPQASQDELAKAYERGRLEHLLCILWDGHQWVAAGTKGVIVTGRSDGTNWQGTRLSSEDRSWYSAVVTHGEQYYLAGARFATKAVKDLSNTNGAKASGESL